MQKRRKTKQSTRNSRKRAPSSIFRNWTNIEKAITKHKTFVLLSDFDGTLTPIVSRPELVRFSTRTQTVLSSINSLPNASVGIISGRALKDVRKLVGIPRIIYVGNHGTEITAPGIKFVHPRARKSSPLLTRIAKELRRSLSHIKGSQVEFKGVSLSVHFRRVAKKDIKEFDKIIRKVISTAVKRKAIRVTFGKCVVEIRPPISWDKGKSVAWVMKKVIKSKDSVVCYLGDDTTDEDAFKAVNQFRGISIFVGTRSKLTRAKWRLKDSKEVHKFLLRVHSMKHKCVGGPRPS